MDLVLVWYVETVSSSKTLSTSTNVLHHLYFLTSVAFIVLRAARVAGKASNARAASFSTTGTINAAATYSTVIWNRIHADFGNSLFSPFIFFVNSIKIEL